MMKLNGNNTITTLILLATALVSGRIFIIFAPSFPVISDSLKYIEIANAISRGTYAAIEGIIYPPGYPTFLSGVFTFFNSAPETIYQIQFLFLGGIAALVFLIARRHMHIPYVLALLSALLILLWPYLILYSLLIMSEIVYIFFSTPLIASRTRSISEKK